MEIKKTLQCKSTQLSYWIRRTETAHHSLVMLHGAASNHTRWSEFLAHTSLTKDWNLLRVDLRGHADSMYRGRISRTRWMEDLDAVIEQEHLPSVVLLGHSLGAEIALDYTYAHPNRVEGLVLIDPVFPDNLQGALGWVRRLKYLLWPLITLLWFLNFLGLRRHHFPARDMHVLDNETRITLAANHDISIAKLYMNPMVDIPYMPLANYLQDIYETVRGLPTLEKITQPVLVIMSSGASLSDLQSNKEKIQRMPNASISLVECNHWPLTEKPEEVRKLIDDWCQQLGGINPV